jgi:hypothetical protein
VFYTLRKLVGTVVLLVFVPAYALFAMALAAAVLPGTGALTQLAYYAAAGLAWVPPAGLIIWWMFRPPASMRSANGH